MSQIVKPKPLIGIICCHKIVDDEDAQVVKDTYIKAIYKNDGIPVLLPAVLAELNDENLNSFLSVLDGILLSGSYSNVSPYCYNATHEELHTDLGRDQLSFKLVDYSRKKNLPLFAICRGLQEINVVYGGELFPNYRKAGFTELHLYTPDTTYNNQYIPIDNKNSLLKSNEYKPIHDIFINKNTLLGGFDVNGVLYNKWKVNSLHNQCISILGKGLHCMAVAPDGLIEAVYDPKHRFMVGVQWHPEGCIEDELSQFLFRKFISAAQE